MHKEKGSDSKAKTHFHRKKSHHNKRSSNTLEEQTLQSLVELQKVHINMAEKFDKLAVNIENLLALFELAARNFAKQPHMQNTERDKEFLEKIDKLLDQNKLLAKGLSLMEEKMRERLYGISPSNIALTGSSNMKDYSQMQPSIGNKLKEV
jgi:hypothetical protein